MNENRKRNIKKVLESYLSKEVVIDYKACLYFYCILVYYCIYLFCKGQTQVSMLYILEMLITTYVISIIQVYLMGNFDEADRIGKKEFFWMVVCSVIYAILSIVFGWFGEDLWMVGVFFAFMLLAYWCLYLANKIKRNIDTKQLNEMLEQYKEGSGQ